MKVEEVLKTIGFEADIAQIYESLWSRGPQTMSELARNSGVERTKLYRLIPLLKDEFLIDTDKEYAHDIIRVTSAERLQELISKRQKSLDSARHALPQLINSMPVSQLTNSRVNVYKDVNGLKQLLWNETNADGEVLSIIQEPIQTKTNLAFFERLVTKCNDRNLMLRGIVGDGFSGARDEWYKTHVNDRFKHWQAKYVAGSTFSIDQNMIIYDDTVAYFVWNSKETFGVEIHNPVIANTQKQFFELLWSSSKSIND